MGAVLAHFAFLPPPPNYTASTPGVVMVPAPRGQVATRVFSAHTPRFAILHCHGNACDIGQMGEEMQVLAETLKCTICTFDYYGYGCSAHAPPSEQNVHESTRAVWNALTKQWHPGQIIVYGQSIGSGGAVHLCQQLTWEGKCPAGLVVHSGFLSCANVISTWFRCLYPADMFENDKKIADITCPTLFIHGTDDTLVPFSHGIQLWEKARRPFTPLWIKGGTHNGIPDTASIEYIQRMWDFCTFVIDNAGK